MPLFEQKLDAYKILFPYQQGGFPINMVPRETHGIVEYCTFVNDFKKIVTNMQSLGKKFPQKKKTFVGNVFY